MKNVLTGFAAGVLLLLAIAYFVKPTWLCGSSAADDSRKPLISLADLAMEVSTREGNNLETLVKLDKQFYKALLQGNKVGGMYFYSRHGSCCPCSTGGTKCCSCSQGSGFGVMNNSTNQAYLVNQALYKFASNSNQKPFDKIPLEVKVIDDVKIFLIPESVADGNYTARFEGNINIELDIAVHSDKTFEVIAIR
ncbi:MAG: hypothetical protein HRU69_06270 [Flammeovirgaceae bacterium]|nr:MAG: hypothetical protein HRU69_06270 [Flammeovirgaceae bacterium]